MFPIQSKVLQPRVASIRHQQQRFRTAPIHGYAVRTIQLSRFLALTAERPNKSAFAVVLVDITRPIAIAHIDIAIGRDSEVSGTVLSRRISVLVQLVKLGFLWIAQRENFLAIERSLHHDAPLRVA